MPRAIWSGTLSFGLVTIPVKLYSAVKPRTVRFHQLHSSDHVRIEQKRVCPADGREVPYEEIVKGYEIAPDRYVVIEPSELDGLAAANTSSIEIEDFVSLAEIDPIYYDSAYYVVPAAGGERPYRLLHEAMQDSEKVAIARVVLRSKQHLVAIRPMGELLGMATMNFADEVVPVVELGELPDRGSQPPEREREIARKLVDSLTVPFDATKYRDSYREAVLELIERKANGEEIAIQPRSAPRPSAPDLMSALQASLEEVRSRSGPAPKGARRARASANGASKPKPGTAKPKPGTAKPKPGTVGPEPGGSRSTTKASRAKR